MFRRAQKAGKLRAAFSSKSTTLPPHAPEKWPLGRALMPKNPSFGLGFGQEYLSVNIWHKHQLKKLLEAQLNGQPEEVQKGIISYYKPYLNVLHDSSADRINREAYNELLIRSNPDLIPPICKRLAKINQSVSEIIQLVDNPIYSSQADSGSIALKAVEWAFNLMLDTAARHDFIALRHAIASPTNSCPSLEEQANKMVYKTSGEFILEGLQNSQMLEDVSFLDGPSVSKAKPRF